MCMRRFHLEQLYMDNKSLLCDEELLISPPPQTTSTSHRQTIPKERCLDMQVDSLCFYTSREDRGRALALCIERETRHMPQAGYVDDLFSSDSLGTRLTAVRWMIKTQCRLNLSHGAVFDAINYFDRYISLNPCKEWNYWMIDLLSIACLSLAAKSNEVSIPSLSDFQVGDLDHSFQSSEIQEMELMVMKALGWRLSCVTAYSYVDLLTWNVDSMQARLIARMTELLLGTLLDPNFIKFRPCAIAVAALRCSLDELLPSKSEAHLADLARVLPINQMEEMNKCHQVMEERIADPLYSLRPSGHSRFPSSPVTVLVSNTIPFINWNTNLALLRPSNPKKRNRSQVCLSDCS